MRYDDCLDALMRDQPELARASVPLGLLGFWCESLGWPDWVLRGTAFADGRSVPSRLAVADDLRLMRNLVHRLGEARLIAMMFEWPRFPGQAAVLAAPDLAAALGFMGAAISHHNTGLLTARFAVEAERGTAQVAVDPQLGPFRPLLELATLSALLLAARTFLAMSSQREGRLPDLTIATCSDARMLAALVPCRVRHDPERASMSLPADLLDLRGPSFDAGLWQAIVAASGPVGALLPRRSEMSSDTIREAVFAALRQSGRVPHLSELAASFARSPRTIERQLAEAGLSYRAIVDEVRMEFACALLTAGDITVQDVSGRVGYSDASAFVRAFRRRFGRSPAQWRKAQPALAGV